MNLKSSGLLCTTLLALLFASILNLRVWQIFFSYHEIDSLLALIHAFSFFLFLFFLNFSFFNLFTLPIVQKWVFIPLCLSSAAAFYFALSFQTYFDDTMIQNIFETDQREALELININLLLSVGLLGIVPAMVIFKSRLAYKAFHHQFAHNLALSGLGLLLAAASIGAFYPENASFIRNNNVALRESLLPSSYLASSYHYLEPHFSAADQGRAVVGADARKSPSWQYYQKPLALVFIVGETARAKSFSLQKHSADSFLTNPNIVYFDHFSSCGTSTAVSVPCMFSFFDRDHYSREKKKQFENVLDVINRSKFDVVWRDNHNGCKGLCDAIKVEMLNQSDSAAFFHENEFYDEALVNNLAKRIESQTKDQVIFLHQMGSHGPAYYHRIPPEFLHNTPSCLSSNLSDCTAQEVENTYNDTVRYTEYVISKAISELESISDRYDTALVYVSDHGESTGEKGLYLHGIPRFLAPSEQTHVPALLWMSDNYLNSRQISLDCMKHTQHRAYSHDYISHTLLGLLDIETSAYQANMDLKDGCHTPLPPLKSAGNHVNTPYS
jgi:lipid A ethanolaminephosphotransferase